jgi:transcriptional regulator with XRE-family HTH domain
MRKKTFEHLFKSIKKKIFEAAFDIDVCGISTINELAEKANLSWQTVERMYEGDTKEPRMRTMFKLAEAIGLTFDLLNDLYEDEISQPKKRKAKRKVRVKA